jgi:hypothetical protein
MKVNISHIKYKLVDQIARSLDQIMLEILLNLQAKVDTNK